MIFVTVLILSIFISVLMCMFFLWIPNLLMRKTKVPIMHLALISVTLAIVSGFVLNLELEAGIMALPVQLVVLSLFWALVSLVSFFVLSTFGIGVKFDAKNT
ncbi:MAG: hypothetical protein AB8D52_11725 [Gammaproteobacteria bacterium]